MSSKAKAAAGKRRKASDDEEFEEPVEKDTGKKAEKKPRKAPAGKADPSSVKTEDTGGSLERNHKIASLLDALASQMSASLKDDPNAIWKQRGLQKAAEAVRTASFPIQTGMQAMKVLAGVGKGTADKIDEIIKTGGLASLAAGFEDPRIRAITDFQRIPGVGAATANKLFEEGVTSLDDLKLRPELLDESQAVGLKYLEHLEKRIPRDRIRAIAEVIVAVAKEVNSTVRVEVCGGYRRGADDDDEINIVLSHAGATAIDNGPDKPPKLAAESSDLLQRIVEELKARGVIADTMSMGDQRFTGICTLQTEEEMEAAKAAASVKEEAEAEDEAGRSAADAFADFEVPDVDDVDAQQAALAKAAKAVRVARAKEEASTRAPAASSAPAKDHHKLMLYMVAENAWVPAVFIHTGPAPYMVNVRARASEAGYKLSEHGLRQVQRTTVEADAVTKAVAARGTSKFFAGKAKPAAASAPAAAGADDSKKVVKETIGAPIALRSEEELCERVGVPYAPPSERK